MLFNLMEAKNTTFSCFCDEKFLLIFSQHCHKSFQSEFCDRMAELQHQIRERKNME